MDSIVDKFSDCLNGVTPAEDIQNPVDTGDSYLGNLELNSHEMFSTASEMSDKVRVCNAENSNSVSCADDVFDAERDKNARVLSLDAQDEDDFKRPTQLPLSKIKHIMKFDPDVSFASQEAVYLITKATEFFIQSLAKEAYEVCKKKKKKTIRRTDIDSCVNDLEEFTFLEGAIDLDVWNL